MGVAEPQIIGVIPSRYGSTRFPGKPLALIHGKPLLQWVVEGVQNSKRIKKFLLATDDSRIADFASNLFENLQVVMTDTQLETGTDRVWQACQKEDCDVVVNIQGDEPLVNGELLDQLCQPFYVDSPDMTTLAREFNDWQEIDSMNTAKVVTDHKDRAIYFSRHPIPYSRMEKTGKISPSCLKHIGLYAYQKKFLERFCAQEPILIEKAEGLEQLRALYLGAKIQVVTVESESCGVDTPDDIARVEKIIAKEKNDE